ncbi:5'-deoxynucleotidase HDDC2 [Neocloeon triangulifer]|uniref:5'-deoxynucleotidase HDDC2 n=1 Tax=Neocloeon triangulifer TaxID=2078957 RepID=UPI00286F3E22|nr:5'-deoxynucleotidase HDDC2 [Neocloeon triangulifer]
MDLEKMNVPNMLEFLRFMNELKHLKRQGWVLKEVQEPETVAGHMYRMAVMSLLFPLKAGLDRVRCMELSLVHDMGESIIGDITPYCGVPRDEKLRREREAIDKLAALAGEGGAGGRIKALFAEYEAQETAEAKFVKELDHLDLLLQAREYEQKGYTDLEEFFRLHFESPVTSDLALQIMADHKAQSVENNLAKENGAN